MSRRGIAAGLAIAITMSGGIAAAEFLTLKGHGGPVMGLAVSPDKGIVASASFDNSVGIWEGRTPHWLERHEAAVNVVAYIDEHHLASAGDDFSIVIWDLDDGSSRRLAGHKGKVMGLAVSPDRTLIASASWDGTIGLWPRTAGEPVFLKGHRAGVNDVIFSPAGDRLYSASVDGTVRIWDVAAKTEERVLLRHGFGVNAMVLAPDETWLAYGAIDGVTRVIDPATAEELADFTLDRRPILALARSADATMLATGDGQGYITVIDSRRWSIVHDFRAALRGPIWALAFSGDGANILAGGIENIVYSWPVADLDSYEPMAESKPNFLRDPDSMPNGERQFMRKCSICHSLAPDGARKAGPTLYGLFGRPAGSVAGYTYSPTVANTDIVWDETTIDRLFDLGPDHFIPGSKMPMQRIVAGSDRRDLIEFLKKATSDGASRQGENR